MSRPKALDLFCGAGGAAMGLYRAGFDIVGIDNRPQPRYPFAFILADALKPPVRLEDFDLVWASPPCQHASTIAKQQRALRHHDHPNLIPQTRDMLRGHPCWVMENVPGAQLRSSVTLCGSQFGLDVRRHRLFETSFAVMQLRCVHHQQAPRFISLDKRRNGAAMRAVPVHGRGSLVARVVGVHGHLNYKGERELRKRAMAIDWMNDAELTQAIPPAYSEHIGHYAMLAIAASREEK